MSLPMMDFLSLPIVLAWFRRKLWKLAGAGAVCAVLAIPVAMHQADVYESSSTLLVYPPAFKEGPRTLVSHAPETPSDSISDMMPRSLPVEVYKTLAVSAPVLDEVIRRAQLEKATVEGLEKSLEVALIQTGVRTNVSYAQVLMLNAKADDPQVAARIAQTWAEVFKEQMDATSAQRIQQTSSLLDTLNNQMKADINQADLALAEHRKQWNLELMQAQIDAKQIQVTEFESDLKSTEVELAVNEMKLKALSEELAKEPRKEAYFRAPSDDAYWNVQLQPGETPKIEPGTGLRTEEPNANYDTIRNAEVTAKADVEAARARKETLALKLDELRKEIEGLTATFADKTVERDKLTRESDNLKFNYEVVRTQYEKGRMADRTQASDIVITGNAVIPSAPSGHGTLKLMFFAGVAGVILMGGFLLIKELSEMFPLPEDGRLSSLVARTQEPAADEQPSSPRRKKQEKRAEQA